MSDNPISPISRTATFPHKTSPAVSSVTKRIDMNTPAINDAPVELDGSSSIGANVGRAGGAGTGVLSPADEEDIDAEFLGGGAGAKGVREERAAMLASRSKDPGVIVDVPKEPTAEEVQAAKSADGSVTPGVGAGRG